MFSIYKLLLILIVIIFVTQKNKIESFITDYKEVDINTSISQCLDNVDPYDLGRCLTNINNALDEMLLE